MQFILPDQLILRPGPSGTLFQIESPAGLVLFQVEGPAFEINGQLRDGFTWNGPAALTPLAHGGEEINLDYSLPGRPALALRVSLRVFPGSPFLRWRYALSAQDPQDGPAALTKSSGRDNLRYFALTLPVQTAQAGFELLSEIQLSQFEPVLHSYLPGMETRRLTDLPQEETLAGPILALHGAQHSLLAAYEHGADHPQSFLSFSLKSIPTGTRLELRANHANYYTGQPLGQGSSWVSPWLQLGLQPGGLEPLLARYRRFILEEINPHPASRKNLICYNTWNYQERNHLYHDRPYLESMNLERMLAEIDAAHQMGIDIFVIDTGWYEKTGDWQVSLKRFPDGLKQVKARLDGCGMQLGLWFNPLAAALTSKIYRTHPEYEMTWDGQLSQHGPIWETEDSASMCLDSDFAASYVEVMRRFREELGVTYFKWDGIGQSGCNSPLHHHGTTANSLEERGDCYAFRMGLAMVEIIEKAAALYPDVIVDFDATECGRFVGLSFLSAGRFFLINNGSYAKDFDTPASIGLNPWMNMFFYPGSARPRVCRRGSSYDFILPSSLFLIHYLPDGPASNRENNLAALVLGGNGIWGDLPALSAEDRDFWASGLAAYKRVAPAAQRAPDRLRGFIGSSPEIHEKLDPHTGAGLLAFFTVNQAEVTHLTQPLDRPPAQVSGADAWEVLPGGRVKVFVKLARDGARSVFFFSE